jgi:HEAT repeat protein
VDKPTADNQPRFSEEMIQDCLDVLERGGIEDLFEIIPRIGVLRDPRFDEHLLALLGHQDLKRREFAAYAMGAVGKRSYFEPLKQAFRESERLRGPAVDELQTAVLEAIGALGDDTAVEFFLPLLKGEDGGLRAPRGLKRRIVEALGAIAQQGGEQSLATLLELTEHEDPEVRGHAVSEIAVAYWHRPNEIPDSTLARIFDCCNEGDAEVTQSALAALESLADVGCRRAEKLFRPRSDES